MKIEELLADGWVKVGSKTYCTYWKKGDEIIKVNGAENIGMKVYIVESLECDYETCTYRDGVFATKELAEEFIFKRYNLVESSKNLCGDNVIKHFYGYDTPVEDSEIKKTEDGDLFYEYFCEYDKEWCNEFVGNQYSIQIIEVDVQTTI